MSSPAAISLHDFCRMWDCVPSDIPALCIQKIRRTQLGFRQLSIQERDEHILHILRRLDELKPRMTEENLKVFEQGWNVNYELCLSQGVSIESLKPGYVRPFERMRYDGDIIAPEDPFLLDELFSIVTTYSFETYLSSVENVYELGCGTGRYLFVLSEIFPEKRLFGLDWTEASQKILKLVAQTGRNVEGIRFDMLNPSTDVVLKPNSAVITVVALEQLGNRFEPILSYLLTNKPKLVIHHEPIEEFYDESRLLDYLALAYHRKRGYLSGYWTALKRLAQEGRIEILDARRLNFGDPYNDTASFIAWQPKG